MIETTDSNYKLKIAGIDDVPVILSFIKELAAYEKLEHEVVATEELLEKTLFGERKTAEVIIGYYNREPVSFALFFHSYSTFLGRPGIYLEDLYVKPSAREKGLGKILISYIGYLAKQRSCGRLEWSCLDWNEPALDFYKSIGAKPLEEWTVQRISGTELNRLADIYLIGD